MHWEAWACGGYIDLQSSNKLLRSDHTWAIRAKQINVSSASACTSSCTSCSLVTLGHHLMDTISSHKRCSAEGDKVTAQKELHELHLDMQVQQERYRQLQEARR